MLLNFQKLISGQYLKFMYKKFERERRWWYFRTNSQRTPCFCKKGKHAWIQPSQYFLFFALVLLQSWSYKKPHRVRVNYRILRAKQKPSAFPTRLPIKFITPQPLIFLPLFFQSNLHNRASSIVIQIITSLFIYLFIFLSYEMVLWKERNLKSIGRRI